MNEKEYSVSEAVRRTGVPSHVLRYWEEELQIMIHRSAQGYRIYTESDLELFRRVKILKEKGIQLKAIRVLLEEQDDGQKYFQEQTLESRIREIVYQENIQNHSENQHAAEYDKKSDVETEIPSGHHTVVSEAGYEIVLKERTPDQLRQFEVILKSMIEEVVAEQNDRLEQSLKECLRDELEIWYMKYFEEIYQEAASAAESRKRSIWERIFKK